MTKNHKESSFRRVNYLLRRIKYPRSGYHWTKKEIDYLKWHYRYVHAKKISKELGRSVCSIYRKAFSLGLDDKERYYNITDLSEISGYSCKVIKNVIEKSGIDVRLQPRLSVGTTNTSRVKRYALTEEQKDEILDLLRKYGSRGSIDIKFVKVGVWGEGNKPDCCIECGTIEREHYGKGRCKPCYFRIRQREQREKRKKQ